MKRSEMKVNVQLKIVKKQLIFTTTAVHFYNFDAVIVKNEKETIEHHHRIYLHLACRDRSCSIFLDIQCNTGQRSHNSTEA